MAVTARAAELTLLFVFDMLVLIAWTSGALAIESGIAVAAFTHLWPFGY